MCKNTDLEFMLKCLYTNTFCNKFHRILENIIETDYELTIKLIIKGVVRLINDCLAYEVNGLISFLENELGTFQKSFELKSVNVH